MEIIRYVVKEESGYGFLSDTELSSYSFFPAAPLNGHMEEYIVGLVHLLGDGSYVETLTLKMSESKVSTLDGSIEFEICEETFFINNQKYVLLKEILDSDELYSKGLLIAEWRVSSHT